MRILIVGGGMGGTILANNLARRLRGELKSGKASITMLSATDQHMYQPGLLYVAVGKMSPDELYRDQAGLLESSIRFEVDPVTKFDLAGNNVTTESGKRHDYDVIVVATGSRPHAEGTPGLAENALQFYTEEDALKMYRSLQEFEGGRVVVAVGVPHKCPMAPLEITFMLIDYFKARGIWDKVQMHYTYPIGRVHSLEPVANWAVPEFERVGVTYETLFNMKEVTADKVISEEGTEESYDLLVTIPSHKGMAVIEENELGAGGFIPTDRQRLNIEGHDNAFVIGDTTNLPISKAGSTAISRPRPWQRISHQPSRSARRSAIMTARSSASSKPVKVGPPTPCSITRIHRIRNRLPRACTGSRPSTTRCTGPARVACCKRMGS